MREGSGIVAFERLPVIKIWRGRIMRKSVAIARQNGRLSWRNFCYFPKKQLVCGHSRSSFKFRA
jgi:hypothetical protein